MPAVCGPWRRAPLMTVFTILWAQTYWHPEHRHDILFHLRSSTGGLNGARGGSQPAVHELQSSGHRNPDVGTETPDPDPGSIRGGACKRFLWQSAKCQQLNLLFSWSSPADKEGIFSLIALFCFQLPFTIIITIGQWQISFNFLHRLQQEMHLWAFTNKTGNS